MADPIQPICVTGITYTTAVDWEDDGTFTGTYDDITSNVLSDGITIAYGREQNRQLSPGAIGHSAFTVCNFTRLYSPENTSSPLYADLGPARPVSITTQVGGTSYDLFRGRLDDFAVHPDRADRSAEFTALDGLALLRGVKISTELVVAQRTGQIIDRILDAVGWTAARDLDPGATFPRYWWAEDTNAFDALQDIVRSEGTPAVAYVAPDGTFVFRDRHHRILHTASTTSQATFASQDLVACDPCLDGVQFYGDGCYGYGLYGG